MRLLRNTALLLIGMTIAPGTFWGVCYADNTAPGPLRVHPSNSHYFTDGSGKAVYLSGSHNDPNLIDVGTTDPPLPFDFSAYVRWLHRHNHNFIRLWRWTEASKFKFGPSDQVLYVQPHPWARTGPGTARDGKLKFDLTKFDEEYFKRLRGRTIEAGREGLYVSIMLFEGAAAAVANEFWAYHPFHLENNINQIEADENGDGKGLESYTLAQSKIVAFQEQYVKHVIETVNDLDNVMYEICNECHEDSTDWQYSMIQFVKDYEARLGKSHPVGMTGQYPVKSTRPDNTALIESPADWISFAGELYALDPPVMGHDKVSLLDSDHIGVYVDTGWVWKSMTRGHNPIFLDLIDTTRVRPLEAVPNKPAVRRNLGYSLDYARKMNLAEMYPHPELCSSSYCLANPGREYLVYVPLPAGWMTRAMQLFGKVPTAQVTMDIPTVSGTMKVEWLNTSTGETITNVTKVEGSKQTFQSPFNADSVLYLVSGS
jgi:hypothetical protein